jgi:hypothetical protein
VKALPQVAEQPALGQMPRPCRRSKSLIVKEELVLVPRAAELRPH